MFEIPRLPDPPPGRDFPDGDAMGWWWYQHPAFEPALFMLYLRTPTGRIACLRNHAVDAKGVVTPSIKVSWPQDGREVVDWHVGSPSPAEAAVLLGWGPQDAERYAEQARQWPKAKG